MKQQSPVPQGCTGRCQRIPGAFRKSALVPDILVCRFCGRQQRLEPAPPTAVSAAPMRSRPTLYTLGYAGSRVETVLWALAARQIRVLLDIRWSPTSQCHGFEPGTLRRIVEGRGMAYRHVPALGSAPDLRYRYQEDGDWAAFASAYLGALEGQDALLGRVAGYARGHPVCLLCAEHDPGHCHRRLLAERLAPLAGLTIEHLTLW
jgi:hypothetical protein